MNNYEKMAAKRLKAQAKGIRNLSADQRQAVISAQEALRNFVSEWTESFDLYDADTPRKLQSAFWKMNNAFDLED